LVAVVVAGLLIVAGNNSKLSLRSNDLYLFLRVSTSLFYANKNAEHSYKLLQIGLKIVAGSVGWEKKEI